MQDKFNIIIQDNDYNPNIGNSTTVFTNDFEGGLGDFTVNPTNASTDFVIGNIASSSSSYYGTSGNTSNFIFVNDDACDCNMSDERFTITNPFDFTNDTEVSLTFDYRYIDDNSASYNNDANVQVSTDGGSNWVTVGGDFLQNTGWGINTVDLSAYAGQNNIMISFFYSDLGNWAYGLSIDNIEVNVKNNASIQTTVNSVTLLPLNSTGTIYTYDTATRNIMTSITNNTSFNYGCVSTNVSRSGTSGQSYNGSIAPDLVLDKTFTINPTNTTTSGNNTVTFYFTETEIFGWETVVAPNTRADLYIIRESASGNEIVVATIDSFGSEVTLTGSFTGLEGVYYFGTQESLNTPDFTADNLFSIYPNPVNNLLTINYSQNNLPNTIQVYNMLGQTIFTKNITNETDLTLNMSTLTSGMYFITIYVDHHANQTFKILKK